jgi:hypothetical protein
MKSFSSLNITPAHRQFEGKKIDITDIIDQQIIVHDFKIEPTKYPDKYKNPNRLTLQIEYEQKKRVVFSGSQNLMDMIEKAGKDNLPFTTTIKNEFKRLIFT